MIGLWNAILILTLIEFNIVYGKLSGDHICVTEKTVLVNSTEFYIKNITVRNYKWCLNYPPRCSYYTTNRVNSTRIAERNETYMVEECCPGFIENLDKCMSPCTNCKNGICENGSCKCLTGFKGKYCDLECSFNEWGPNCTKPCACNNNNACNSMTGICLKEIKIVTTETICVTADKSTIPQDNQDSHLTTESFEKVTVNKDQLGPKNENVNLTKVTQNEMVTPLYNFTKQTSNSKTVMDDFKNIDLQDLSTTETIFTNENELATKLNERYLNTSINDTAKLPNSTKHSTKQTDQILERTFSAENIFPIKTFSNGTIATKIGLLIPVEIQYDKLQTAISNDTRLFSNEEYLNRDVYKNDYSSKDFILFAIAIMVAFVGVLAILTINIMRKRKLNQNVVQHESNQVAVFSASIFNSPLPAIREYEYDHPASTGSYNAPSVFNPVELKNHQIFEQTSEPIYDEIPHKEFEHNANDINSTIYVNTLGRTKL